MSQLKNKIGSFAPIHFTQVDSDKKTLFDTDRSPLQPNYTKLSVEEFDLYAFTVYTFMNIFWESFNIESNRITKKFRFWIQRNIDDFWENDSLEFGNGQLSRIEEFFTALNWHFLLYDTMAMQNIDWTIRENNYALSRPDFWNADKSLHPFMKMKDDIRLSVVSLQTVREKTIEKNGSDELFHYSGPLHILKTLYKELNII